MNSLIAIGAGIAALTGIGAGIGIGLATSKANGRNRKTAGSRRKNHKSIITWMCIGRRYCNFRYGCCNFNYLILRLRKGSGRECNY